MVLRVPPVPIPNTEVKPQNADGTAGAAQWESRLLPASFFLRQPFWVVESSFEGLWEYNPRGVVKPPICRAETSSFKWSESDHPPVSRAHL